MIAEKKGLGRGLASLLGDETNDYAQLDKLRSGVKNIPIGQIHPGKYQPRRDFDADALQQLADSIKSKGILQPIVVRRDPNDSNSYELIAGERRWRAAQKAQLHEIPVLIKDLSDRDAMQIALIENLQRQDLNPIEEAEAFHRLTEEFDQTQEDIAKGLGKSRSYVANIIRLLDLPKVVREYLRAGSITVGHAKLLVGRADAETLTKQIIDNGWNVRQLEASMGKGKIPTAGSVIGIENRAGFTPANDVVKASARDINRDGPDANTRDLEKQLSQLLGMRVEIRFAGKAGQLTIHYQDLDQLDDVITRLGKK